MMTDIRSLQIPANVVNFECLVGGTHGPWVLLLHGFPDDASSMIPLMNALAIEGYRTLAPYMRGYGGSTFVGSPSYLIGELASDAIALARSVSDDQVHIIGHDWGAIAAYAACNLAPETFASVTGLSVPPLRTAIPQLFRFPSQLKKSAYIAFFQLPTLPESTLAAGGRGAWFRELYAQWSPGWTGADAHLERVLETFATGETLSHALGYYRSLLPPSLNLRTIGTWLASWNLSLQQIEVPGLLIRGENDGCVDPRLFKDAEDAFVVETELLSVAGAGHFVHIEKPDVVHSAIRRWLAAHPVGES